MLSKTDSKVIGVIVARFQVPFLHEGHRYIIDYVLERHETVLVVLGVSYAMTDRNPLSFEMRKGMLESCYPGKLTIVPSDSLPSSYEERSRKIDEIIKGTFPDCNAVVYGSRDSFIHTYKGFFEKREVPTVFSGSATEIRQNIGIINSSDFRSGVIYSAVHRKRIGYPTVDVAILNSASQQVLLVGKKEEEGKFRFPGVFFDPEVDGSYEDAGIRCVEKEILTIKTSYPTLIKSHKIDDWRFRKTHDGVITILMRVEYISGVPVVGKGIDNVCWVDFADISSVLVECHKPLGEIIKDICIKS